MHTAGSPLALRLFLLSALGFVGCQNRTVTPDDDVTGTGGRTEGSGGRTEGSGGRTGTGSTTGGGGSGEAGCTDPKPLLEGHDTGIFRCGEGYLHRAEALTCPTELPRDRTVEWPDLSGAAGASSSGTYTTSADECSRDEDCGDALERCELRQTNPSSVSYCGDAGPQPEPTPDFVRECVRGCREDADCEGNQVCVCGSPIGQCAAVVGGEHGCTSDADCPGDALCLQNARTSELGGRFFACQLPGDECATDNDCDTGLLRSCIFSGTARTCQQRPICGRPFLVETEARLALASERSDWLCSPEATAGAEPLPVTPELAAELVRHWTDIGLMEHASIAAFARFTLQLLALGAPAELVEASNQAQADETRHARLAFDLASHYAGTPVGPGALSLAGTVLDEDWEAVLSTTIAEGCIGETCAALEASHAAELSEDPAVSATLRAIARDEAEHAALAWRAVRWMLETRPALRAVARGIFDALSPASSPSASTPRESDAERYGALSLAAREACRELALRQVVLPCAAELLQASPSDVERAPLAAAHVLSV